MNLDFFKEFAFFTKNDLEAYLHINNPEVIISKLNKEKKIIKIEKGKYTLYDDSLIYLTIISSPSYLSGFSALNYYGYSNQIQLKNVVLTTNQKKSIRNCNFIKVKKEFLFGFNKIKYKNFEIYIVNKEKLLIDCIY